MTETSSSDLPRWVSKRDGRLVPFDADEICQAIFAVTEELRQPNAFLAREMTESVLHFLTQEFSTQTPTTAQIADLIVKVLRELDQSALALTLERRRKTRVERSPAEQPRIDTATSPAEFLAQCRRRFSLQAVFSRDLVAAQEEGWLTLIGLEHPAELEGGVVDWPSRDERSLLSVILEASRRFGAFLALDGPEHALPPGQDFGRSACDFVRDLKDGLEATDLSAVVNLNAAQWPAWAQQPGEGPLFHKEAVTPTESMRGGPLLDAILDEISEGDRVRIDWHLGERDLSPASRDLQHVVRRALEGMPISFVLDRPPLPLALGEGLDRRHPAVLQVVGLHLGPLVDVPGVEGNGELLLQKLLHVSRMALSAAAQKRHFLRRQAERHHDLRRGFFLDRARLTVIPVGLPAVVERLTGQSIATGKQGLALGKQIVQRLSHCLAEAGRSANLDAVLDGPWWTARQPGTGPLLVSPHLVGLTCADFQATVEDQLKAAGVLHESAGAGTVTLTPSPGKTFDIEQVTQMLRFALRKTDVVRIRLGRVAAAVQQSPDLLSGK